MGRPTLTGEIAYPLATTVRLTVCIPQVAKFEKQGLFGPMCKTYVRARIDVLGKAEMDTQRYVHLSGVPKWRDLSSVAGIELEGTERGSRLADELVRLKVWNGDEWKCNEMKWEAK